MATKPTLYPDWAVKVDGTDNNVVDGTTGENNVVAPSAGKKLTGWNYNEKPPRQYFNWLSRLSTQWIRWFDQEVDAHSVEILSASRSYISGLYVGAPAGTPHTVDIGVGSARAYDNSDIIALASTFNKSATANWAAGSGNGGFPSGLTIANNTFYNVFMIKNPSTGAVDAGFDTENDASNLLADATGFTLYRRVGIMFWLSTAFDRGAIDKNTDTYFLKTYRSATLNLNTVSGGFLASSALGPTKANVHLIVGSSAPTLNGVYGFITDPSITTTNIATPSESYHDVGSNAASVKTSIHRKHVYSNNSNAGTITYLFNSDPASGTIIAYLYGWVDTRRDNA